MGVRLTTDRQKLKTQVLDSIYIFSFLSLQYRTNTWPFIIISDGGHTYRIDYKVGSALSFSLVAIVVYRASSRGSFKIYLFQACCCADAV
jgi:hypothetical protein